MVARKFGIIRLCGEEDTFFRIKFESEFSNDVEELREYVFAVRLGIDQIDI